MPMYEYYCKPCHTIFSFLARTANVTSRPACPRCGGDIQKQVSSFAFSQKMKGAEKLPFSTQQAEEGVKKLKNEIDRLKSEESPQRAEKFKKNFERWSGVKTPVRRAGDLVGNMLDRPTIIVGTLDGLNKHVPILAQRYSLPLERVSFLDEQGFICVPIHGETASHVRVIVPHLLVIGRTPRG
ncbi:MAG: zinc ribbon domain-containing protein, partial [Proteobacteria bacterium]|nr:zinc ribbon domain-containing protein [Pseudomonadota bacterium]